MRSLILRQTSRLLIGLVLLLAVFSLLRGHDEPGGGFIGGLLAASTIALLALADGVARARRILRVDPRTLAAAGVACMVAAAVAGPLAGRSFLTGLWAKTPIPGLGKISTVLLFDVGVFLAVLGAALLVLLTLGEDEEEDR